MREIFVLEGRVKVVMVAEMEVGFIYKYLASVQMC